ncbi:MAG: hypothetical protein Q8P51_18270 [Ignavibacteria bacterium]|nr:hypothetical protein [Ignavibacteria bacterium]
MTRCHLKNPHAKSRSWIPLIGGIQKAETLRRKAEKKIQILSDFAPWRAILVLVIALSYAVQPLHAQEKSSPGFAFIPFENKSDFKGKWDVGIDVPRFLSAYVKERYRIPTISPVIVKNFFDEQNHQGSEIYDVRFWVELFRRFGVRYLVAGTVEMFDVSRFMTGQPMVGGYEAFKGEVGITFAVYDLERTAFSSTPVAVKKGDAAGEFADRSLTLTLFGKQSDRTVEYRELDKIRFGSEDFNRTVIGQACFQLGERLAVQLETAIPGIRAWAMTDPDSLLRLGQSMDTLSLSFKPSTISGTVVFVEGENAFINLGSEDGVRPGQQILVHRDPMAQDAATGAIGQLHVVEVRGPHLSLARIVNGQKSIRVKDKISVSVIR